MDKYTVTVMIRKYAEMVYYSQLDLTHVLERALRRTELPLYFTKGFNPHVKVSFKSGLRVGLEGSIETSFYFTAPVSAQSLREALTPQLPHGLSILLVGNDSNRS